MRFQLAYSVMMQAVWGMSYVNVDTRTGRDPDNDVSLRESVSGLPLSGHERGNSPIAWGPV